MQNKLNYIGETGPEVKSKTEEHKRKRRRNPIKFIMKNSDVSFRFCSGANEFKVILEENFLKAPTLFAIESKVVKGIFNRKIDLHRCDRVVVERGGLEELHT